MTASKPTIIVTGASGFLGRAVVDSFSKHFEVIGFDHHLPSQPPAGAEFIGLVVTSVAIRAVHTGPGATALTRLFLRQLPRQRACAARQCGIDRTSRKSWCESLFQLLTRNMLDVLLWVLFCGVVDQYVDAAKGIDRLAKDFLAERGIADVAVEHQTAHASAFYRVERPMPLSPPVLIATLPLPA